MYTKRSRCFSVYRSGIGRAGNRFTGHSVPYNIWAVVREEEIQLTQHSRNWTDSKGHYESSPLLRLLISFMYKTTASVV